VSYTESTDDDTGTFEDLAKVVEGTRWLLKPWVPYGMLSGTIGEPKAGKSAWVLWYLARPIVLGLPWFTEQRARKAGHVLWVDTEGSIGVTLERAKMWGLPRKRLLTPYKDPLRTIDLYSEADMKRVLDVVCRYKVELVVVDSYRGAHDKDENNSASGVGLKKLVDIAQRTGAAVHVIHHTGKMAPGTEITPNHARGSNVYVALVRCLLGIDAPAPGGDWRRCRVLCENFGSAPLPMGFRWVKDELEDGPAPERPPAEKRETGKDRAEAWLRVRMKPGVWYVAKDITDEAEAAGFSPTGTLQRAKAALGVKSRKEGKGWEWMREEVKVSPNPGSDT
jgi:hypothetical protein